MRTHAATLLCLLALVLAAGSRALAASPPDQGSKLEDRVARLETDLARQRETVARLESALGELAEGAREMAETLDRSEAQGFTAGINYQSRETLLSGWRAYLARVEKVAPPARSREQTEASSRRRR